MSNDILSKDQTCSRLKYLKHGHKSRKKNKEDSGKNEHLHKPAYFASSKNMEATVHPSSLWLKFFEKQSSRFNKLKMVFEE